MVRFVLISMEELNTLPKAPRVVQWPWQFGCQCLHRRVGRRIQDYCQDIVELIKSMVDIMVVCCCLLDPYRNGRCSLLSRITGTVIGI